MTDAPATKKTMNEQGHCAQCGAPLPRDIAGGICPQCELRGALNLSADPPQIASGPAAHGGEPAAAALSPSRHHSSIPPLHPSYPIRFGDYELLQEIARGGMGVVYRARQISLDRIVAVKMLLFGALSSAQTVQRFRSEAAAAASLQHPHILAIYEVGFNDGLHFFAMEYVAGRSLAAIVKDGALLPRRAATYLKSIAEAIHYAHERNILHRDLKPSNVLIDSLDQPKVTDFGLAKRLETEIELTLSGQLLGSPNYMPPEQAAAKRGAVGKRSDVYALGAILYHLLTCRPPFVAPTVAATLQEVLNTEPVSPRVLNPGVPPDLETICLKCLEKDSAKRYQSAAALAEELGRYLNDESIQARPVATAEKIWRWCRRKPVTASLGAATMLLMVAVAIGSPIAVVRINRERQRVEQARKQESQQRQQAEAQAYTSDMNLVQQAWDEGNLRRAQALLRAHIPEPGQPDLRGFEWRYLWQLCQDESRYAFTNFEHDVDALAFSPDGKFLAVCAGPVIKLLDINSKLELGELRNANKNDTIYRIAFSPKSTNILATAGQSGVIHLWNLTTKEATPFAEHLSEVDSIEFSPDGKMLAAAFDLALGVWNVESKRLLWTSTNSHISPRTVAFTPDGT
ncbi:MAG: hypothetical protein DME26_05960, partial [Verrucomicrobia bacterium]